MQRNSERAPLRRRRAALTFSPSPVYWNGGDAFRTRFLDALSVSFPDGERFFIDAVRAFEAQIEDPALREEIRLFVQQEAEHGVAHEKFNDAMRGQCIDVDRILRTLKGDIREAKRVFSPTMQLAITAAAEHLTASLAEGLIELAPELIEGATPEMRALYLWHSVEEIEHKAVAFDVLARATDATYATRAVAMLAVTLFLHVRVGLWMREMLTVDGLAKDRALLVKGLFRMYGPRGYLTKLVPRFFAWFKPGFHPWDDAAPDFVRHWSSAYEAVRDPLRATASALTGGHVEHRA